MFEQVLLFHRLRLKLSVTVVVILKIVFRKQLKNANELGAGTFGIIIHTEGLK